MNSYVDVIGNVKLAESLTSILKAHLPVNCAFRCMKGASSRSTCIGIVYCVCGKMTMDAINKNLEVFEKNYLGVPVVLIIVDKNGPDSDWEQHPELSSKMLRVSNLTSHIDKICSGVDNLIRSSVRG